MYCQKCGAKMNGNFCPSCGAKNGYQYSYNYSRPINNISHSACVPNHTPFDVVQTVRRHEKISNTLWLIIGIIQCLLGLIQPSVLVAGIWNVVNSIVGLVAIKNIQPHHPGIIEKYRKDFINILIFIAINLIFGGIIGVALCGYDLYIRHYVLKNQYAFYEVGGDTV